ncbi:MAG: UDP-N-acetylglucosamine--N-acetylmuramyl-(pentapeptide) pyrophosphoryl-undecaprenol N-acetylglucosamine transferase [Clostridia bacterium]|nr:UDP-N-acetylglucosamine--N-acetylmuramyl-(pentapeptide) pyrophosphoryl-undecaprenol N-acetylglucosamine transferase [Clostridia bacterium]
MTTIALTGGGTAGHILPCLALIPELKKHFIRIIHIGGDGMETELIPKAGIPLFQTKNVKFDRSNLLANLKIPFVLSAAATEAKNILKEQKVDVVFGKGGYAMLPTILGAHKLGIPIVIHESDYNMGLANKFASRYANAVLTSFPETKGGDYVGNPIRNSIFNGNKQRTIRSYDLNADKKTILIFGGSSGAKAINNVVFQTVKDLTEKYNVIHLVGKQEKRRLYMRGYVSIPYADNIEDLYAAADLIVIRGGANSLQEATMLGKRVVCIPLPKGSHSRGDQVDNALSYFNRGLIDVLPQEELTANALLKKIHTAINQKEHPITKDTPNGEIVKRIMDVIS